MNKARLEAFSDGVFSIVMTLLILDVKVPELEQPVSDTSLLQAIGNVYPHIVLYALTFAVLSVLWINHHFLFQFFAKSVDRWLNLMNLAYLMFIAFVPFSANLLGMYSGHKPAAIIYGLNLLCIMLIATAMMRYIHKRPELQVEDSLTPREFKQAAFRGGLSISCYLIGMVCSFIFVPLAVFFYVFPVIFNIIPGTLNMAERIFGFRLG